jgi:hypothetical protein
MLMMKEGRSSGVGVSAGASVVDAAVERGCLVDGVLLFELLLFDCPSDESSLYIGLLFLVERKIVLGAIIEDFTPILLPTSNSQGGGGGGEVVGA